mmetsp:Transcript_35993/g.107600  ORF Transcript_35993/g.107600 Transcript_35993/m.107600 type:complete len:170 (+) Transcript_35993:186-695(+)
MIGRAGRPGFDTSGTAVIMTDTTSKPRYDKLTRGLEVIESQLLHKMVETINTEVSQRVITKMSVACDWIKGTFFFSRVTKNPTLYGMQGKSDKEMNDYLLFRCTSCIQELHECGIISIDGSSLKPLPGSHCMSQHMVEFKAMKSIVRCVDSIPDLLLAVCFITISHHFI